MTGLPVHASGKAAPCRRRYRNALLADVSPGQQAFAVKADCRWRQHPSTAWLAAYSSHALRESFCPVRAAWQDCPALGAPTSHTACEPSPRPRTVDVLSVDAWRDGVDWTWNNWHRVGKVPAAWLDLSKRRLLRLLREEGYLSPYSAGRVQIEDDGYNVCVQERSGRTVFALAYGDLL